MSTQKQNQIPLKAYLPALAHLTVLKLVFGLLLLIPLLGLLLPSGALLPLTLALSAAGAGLLILGYLEVYKASFTGFAVLVITPVFGLLFVALISMDVLTRGQEEPLRAMSAAPREDARAFAMKAEAETPWEMPTLSPQADLADPEEQDTLPLPNIERGAARFEALTCGKCHAAATVAMDMAGYFDSPRRRKDGSFAPTPEHRFLEAIQHKGMRPSKAFPDGAIVNFTGKISDIDAQDLMAYVRTLKAAPAPVAPAPVAPVAPAKPAPVAPVAPAPVAPVAPIPAPVAPVAPVAPAVAPVAPIPAPVAPVAPVAPATAPVVPVAPATAPALPTP